VPASPAAVDGHESALLCPVTAASLRRLTVLAWVVMAVGLAGVAGIVAGLVAADRADTDLRATGVTVSGTIVHVDADDRYDPGGAEVVYRDATGGHTAYVRLDDHADEFTAGQDVEVVYDPADADRITIDDVPWTPRAADAVQGLSIVPAVVGLLGGPLLLQVRSRTRRLVVSRVWTPVRIAVHRGRGRTFFTEDATAWQSYLAGRWPERPDGDQSLGEHDAWWVTDGRRAVFSPNRGGPLVLTRLDSRRPLAP